MSKYDCLDLIVRKALFEKQAALDKLEVEESGRVVASLQGHIAGYKQIVLIIAKEFVFIPGYLSILHDNSDKDILIADLEDEELALLAINAKNLINSTSWENVMKDVLGRTEELKSFLLFKAEKSRDLDVGQGTYHGMTIYESFFKAIDDEVERREKAKKTKKQELPFDSDGPAGNPGVSSAELKDEDALGFGDGIEDEDEEGDEPTEEATAEEEKAFTL